MSRLTIPQVLLSTGLVVVLGSVGWWWLTYQEVIRYDYIGLAEASACLVSETSICHLARALCRSTHPLAIIDYRSPALWLGVAALSASLIVQPSARAKAAGQGSKGGGR
jgi:hypothetical protein